MLIFGAGASGLAAFRYIALLIPQSLALADDAEISSEKQQEAKKSWPLAEIFSNGLVVEEAIKADVIVLSPGIPRTHPAIAAALARGILVVNEIEVAAEFLPACCFIGVTGTNGKSTVTSMIGAIIQEFCPHTFIGGNLGRPLCEALLASEKPQFAVVELSSYQLESINNLSLKVAVVTNLAPDHLDRYDDEYAYYHAKGRIIDLLLDDGAIFYGSERALEKLLTKKVSAKAINKTVTLPERIQIPAYLLAAPHSVENAHLAIKVALFLGIDEQSINQGLLKYQPLAHRFEYLGVIDGVTWINDSKATNVDAVIAAMQGFNSNVHIILGGLGKKNDYDLLAKRIKHAIKAVYAVGKDAEEIMQVFSPICPATLAHSIDKAAQAAKKAALPGDVIILCPACASFDQFKNYLHRGDFFREQFLALQHDSL